MRRNVILTFLGCILAWCNLHAQYYLEYNEPQFLSIPDPPYDGYVASATWHVSNPNLSFDSHDEAGAIIYPNHYFDETSLVTCSYRYEYYRNGHMQTGTRTATYSVSFKSNNATLSKSELSMPVGKTEKLTYKLQRSYNSSNYGAPKMTWESNRESVATVDKNGKVTAVSPGSATITFDPVVGPPVYCEVTVISNPPTAISLPSTSKTKVGESVTLSPTLTPSDAYATIKWKSSNENVATVSGGKVTGKNVGKTTITATTDNNLSAECVVTVEKGSVTITADTESGLYASGKTITLKASQSDADIYYTLNGTTPTTSSTRYTGQITLTKSATLKAIATGSNYETSSVLTKQYQITSLTVKTSWSETEEQTPFFIPVVTFSKDVSKNISLGNVKLSKGSIDIDGTPIIQDGKLYFVPKNELISGTYTLSIPENAVIDGNGEPNLKIQLPLLVGEGFEADPKTIKVDGSSYLLRADGSVWTWGYNKFGRLGIGTTDDVSTPVKVMDDVMQLEGDYSSYAIKTDGTLWAWGGNQYGQVGDGTTTDRLSPVKILNDVKHVYFNSKGSAFALKTDGTLWAWGNNEYAQLGDGTTTTRLSPVKIMENVVQFSGTNAIKNDGTLWAWGYYVGDGTTTVKLSPVKIMDGVASVVGEAGEKPFTLAIKTDGTLWAWGYNRFGRIGDGTSNSRVTPIKVLDNVVKIVRGFYDNCYAIKSDGTLWAWGRNYDGALGDGTETTRKSPVKVLDDVTDIAAGYEHALAIKKDGTLWAWGSNSVGQVGNGSTMDRYSPVKIMDNVTYISTGWFNSSCIKADGTLWTWGANGSGELGDGTTIKRTSPVCIIGKTTFNHVTAVSLPTTMLRLAKNTQYVLIPTSSPSKSCFESAVFESSNPQVASVSSRGIVEAKATGKATVTIKVDGKYTATCNIEVQARDIDVMMSADGYATFYDSEQAFTMPSGISAQVVTGASNSKITYQKLSGNIIPKNVPVMLVNSSRRAGTYTLTASDRSDTYNGTNLLRGNDVATTTTGDGYHYKLSYGQPGSNLNNVFGWYWGAQNGAPFQIEGHKAWLVVPKSVSATRGFAIGGEATGIEMVSGDDNVEADAVYYDLQGRRVTKPTVKGVYIKNGKKVMVK